jgi:hypothetical protein
MTTTTRVKQDFLFGMGTGHRSVSVARIAKKHGARLVNYTEPDGRKRHWFAAENLGAPHDEWRACQVLAEIRGKA